MTEKAFAPTEIAVARAQYYPPESEVSEDAHDGVLGTGMTHLRVDFDVVELGFVTLSAAGGPASEACGYEFDMTPEGAHLLAQLLEEAAVMARATDH
jgi:hypothetical protein